MSLYLQASKKLSNKKKNLILTRRHALQYRFAGIPSGHPKFGQYFTRNDSCVNKTWSLDHPEPNLHYPEHQWLLWIVKHWWFLQFFADVFCLSERGPLVSWVPFVLFGWCVVHLSQCSTRKKINKSPKKRIGITFGNVRNVRRPKTCTINHVRL